MYAKPGINKQSIAAKIMCRQKKVFLKIQTFQPALNKVWSAFSSSTLNQMTPDWESTPDSAALHNIKTV